MMGLAVFAFFFLYIKKKDKHGRRYAGLSGCRMVQMVWNSECDF